jgi:hypothetical protein
MTGVGTPKKVVGVELSDEEALAELESIKAVERRVRATLPISEDTLDIMMTV